MLIISQHGRRILGREVQTYGPASGGLDQFRAKMGGQPPPTNHALLVQLRGGKEVAVAQGLDETDLRRLLAMLDEFFEGTLLTTSLKKVTRLDINATLDAMRTGEGYISEDLPQPVLIATPE